MIEKLGITPGPWENLDDVIRVDNPNSEYHHMMICKVPPYIPSQKENARLIAAAPEMLEALVDNMITWERQVCDENKLEDMRRTIEAIEKATGLTWIDVKELIDE